MMDQVIDDMPRMSVDECTGVDLVRRVLDAPMRQIIANASDEAGAVMAEVLRANTDKKFTHGYNAVQRNVSSMIDAGIVDPAKVVRNAILNASSVAGLMLTTECIVTDEPGDKGCSCHPTDQMAIPLG
jgi:chaperonin GroEL